MKVRNKSRNKIKIKRAGRYVRKSKLDMSGGHVRKGMLDIR
jgi:hypothetical protein